MRQAIMRVRTAIPIAATARHSPLQIAFNEVIRQSIMADPAWHDGAYYDDEPPDRGLSIAWMITEQAHSITGIDIQPGAEIAESFFIDYGAGVVIGETSIIGNRVRIYQGVTLGAKSFQKDDQGMLVKWVPRHPIIEDDIIVYSGATILGRVTIGRGSVIGGNVWLVNSVPPDSRIIQAQVCQSDFSDGAGI